MIVVVVADAVEKNKTSNIRKPKQRRSRRSKRTKKQEELPSVAVLAARETALAELGSRNSNIGDSIISNNSCISNGRYRGEGRNRKNGM